MKNESIAVIISDQKMHGITGVELFKEVKVKYPNIVRVLITGYTDLEAAIDAINKGDVYRYIKKTASLEEINNSIKQSIERYHLQQEKNRLFEANKRLLKRLATQEKVSAIGYFENVLYEFSVFFFLVC